jgi:hypothetical protein
VGTSHLKEPLKVDSDGWMIPHLGIHRRSDDDRDAGRERQQDRAQRIIGEPEGHSRKRVSSQRGHAADIGPLCPLDVIHGSTGCQVTSTYHWWGPTEAFEAEWSDELGGALGHDDPNFMTGFQGKTGEVERLVGRNSAADSQEQSHSSSPLVMMG